ncbi:hypothetical protein [Bradyrhizobium sp. McL0615]|uniref:hypothetical protein n=1 Tax=Bradyrhizobium sp. McL0615 TaxID=3415673 RepID=UPI003CEB9FD2
MKPGRRSINDIMTPNVRGEAPRIVAPSTLTPREKKVFNEIVNACSPQHFRSSDIPLLQSYVTATLTARATANKPKLFPVFEKAARLQKSLATSLRLAPSTRSDPKTIGRETPQNNAPMPWDKSFRYVGSDDDDDAA